MSKFNQLCLALIGVYVLISCAAPLQHMGQIQCRGHYGQLIYAGPYDAENVDEYIVQVDNLTRDFYHKGTCQKVTG